MDGTKRKAGSSPVPPTKPIDMGSMSTPLWAGASMYHQVSAIRSTQMPANSTVDQGGLHQRSATAPTNIYSRTAPNEGLKIPPIPQGRSKNSKRTPLILPPNVRDDDENDEHHVDTDNDKVYFKNANESSWSGSLPSEDDPGVRKKLLFQAEIALAHLKRKQAIAEQQGVQNMAEIASKAMRQTNSLAVHTSAEGMKWQRDLLLRNVMRRIRQKLRAGAVLTVQRMGPVNVTTKCAHPYCPALNKLILTEAYHFILRHPSQPKAASRYCISCLEELWNGRDMVKPLLSTQVILEKPKERQRVPSFTLDGAMDDLTLESPGVDLATGSTCPSSITTSRPTSSHTASTPATEFDGTATSPLTSPIESDLDADVLQADSPLMRKSKRRSKDEEATRIVTSMTGGAATVAEKLNNASNRSTATRRTECEKTVRRSARLQSVTTGDAPPPAGRALAKDTVKTATPSDIHSIADEVRKADARLEVMYGEREKAIESLKPGQSTLIKHPKASSEKSKRRVSMDEFGMVHTDLLVDTTKYWTKQPAWEKAERSQDLVVTDVQPKPNKSTSSSNVDKYDLEERWCTCRGLDCGEKMIKCDNAKCLIGWYHVECIGEDVDDEVNWFCPLCSSQLRNTDSMPGLPISPEVIGDISASPHADHLRTNIYTRLLSSRDLQSVPRASGDENPLSPPAQLDGTGDNPHLPHRPPSTSPLNQILFDGPKSLLSSKHAPRPEELSSFPIENAGAKTPTLPFDMLPETPGSPSPSPESTMSTGEWRHPPTRFQHLARYIEAGNSLNEREKHVVEVWKEASIEQLDWEDHLRQRDKLRREFANLFKDEDESSDVDDDAQSVGCKVANEGLEELEDGEVPEGNEEVHLRVSPAQCVPSAEEETDGSERELEAYVGLSKQQCRGKDLSAVLVGARTHGRE